MGFAPATLETDAPRLAAIPEVGFCAEKHRLRQAFLQAVHNIGRLQIEQIRALIGGAEPTAG